MTAQQLKNSILQWAIQGKLVEQRKEEGTAKDLIEQIKAEKEQLVKDKKIKKEKPLPEITEDEIPFDIPESWEWVRIGEIITYQNGYAYNSNDMSPIKKGYPVIKSGSIMSLKVIIDQKTDYVSNPTEKMLGSKIEKNDMLMCLSSQSNNPEPLGKTAIYEFDTPALLNQRVLKMKVVCLEMIKYLYYTINSRHFHYTVSHQGGGSAQANLKLEHVLGMLVPIPPLEEQKRIVAKIEELITCVEQYDKAYTKLQVFNKKFPEDMQKSILQYAIQGKLVEQREEEGTAEEIYQQIQEEKARLIKEGKIKKEKPLPEIVEDEKPFDIPESWRWVKLGNLAWYLDAGKSPNCMKENVKNDEWGVITTTAIQTNYFDQSQNKILPKDFTVKPEMQVRVGDILITRAGPTNRTGVACFVEDIGYNLILSDKTVRINLSGDLIDKAFITCIINSPGIRKFIINLMSGMDKQQVNISQDKIRNIIIPLPPLEEQKRIVAKIEEMLPVCKQLIK